MACESRSPVVSAAHVELFAANRVVIVPAGIGLKPPLRIRGARIRAGRCAYPLRTLDPTGLILLGSGGPYTLGDLFDIWGQPLGRTVMAGFHASSRGRVSVFVDGAPWHGDPPAAPLAPGSQITVEVGARVPPHAGYTFPSLAWARS
ncbi:MAG TPA: hypothetical protein VG053_00065 [Solirubrobacteraceae bacterium]|jgi:hypothetical protein|nr:hypothetical protein [Solirubrobacteraceae bacterium]